jgi:DNA-directed RNA polymerase specialized sigma24 family protein
MTAATRKALEKVRDLLHEAGWDRAPRTHPAQPAELSEQGITPIREAFSALLRDDDLVLLRTTLGGGQAVEDAGRALGLTADQARSRFAEALRRLCAFAEVAEAQGYAAGTRA